MEFKFRAWDINSNKFVGFGRGFSEERKSLVMPAIYDDDMYFTLKNNFFYIDELNLHYMQFTGILDKNDVEIFEGDIVKFGNTNRKIGDRVYNDILGKVIFRKANFVITDNNETMNYWLGSPQIRMLEVIGNIYENSELLS